MRLRNVAIAVVLTWTALAGTGAAALPARATMRAAGAAATNPAVTIRAIDREGKQVAVTASLESPTICTTCIGETLTSAHPTRVPRGTYSITAWVQEPGGNAETLVSRELVLSRSVTVVFDARKGRRVSFVVNDRSAAPAWVLADPYAPRGWAASTWDTANPQAPTMYAVPGRLAPGYVLFLEANLVRPATSLSPVEYVLVKQVAGSIPANLTFSYNTARLASDRVIVRRIDPGEWDQVNFRPVSPDGNPGDLPSQFAGQAGTTPYAESVYLSPGYEWETSTATGTDTLNHLPVLRAGHYSQTFDSSPFGPSASFGVDASGSQVQTVPAPFGGDLLTDPVWVPMSIGFGLQVSSSQIWLYRGSTLIAHVKNNGLNVTVPAAPHWYTMRLSMSRGAGALLFRSETLSLRFLAPSAWDWFWPRLIPAGLNWFNAARHGTKTTVPLWFTDLNGDNLAVHDVRMWASVNGGKTWYPQRLTRSGTRWQAMVTNPARAGFVSLRVQGTNQDGYAEGMTVINAYAVS